MSHWSPAAGEKEVATSHPKPTCKAPEPTTVDSGQEVLLHELAALRRSEAVLRDFIETSTIGLHWVGADGTILWVNQAELDLLGYAREEYVGRNIAEFHADASVIHDMLGRLSRGETLLTIRRGCAPRRIDPACAGEFECAIRGRKVRSHTVLYPRRDRPQTRARGKPSVSRDCRLFRRCDH